MKNNVIGVCGSRGSGKTVLATKLARELSNLKNDVILISADAEEPGLPLLQPNRTVKSESLGLVLSMPKLSETGIIRNLIPVKKHLSLLAYNNGENLLSFSEFEASRAKELIAVVKKLTDFVIIDCTSNITSDTFTAAAIQESNFLFRMFDAGLPSLVFYKSQDALIQNLLRNEHTHFRRVVTVLNNVLPSQDAEVAGQALGGYDYVFLHAPEIVEQLDTGKLLDETVFGKNGREFEFTVKRIVQEVVINGQEPDAVPADDPGIVIS